jgi:hypothetical protein
MAAFSDELRKLAGAAGVVEKGLPFLKQHGKPLALLGAGATGYHMGKKELDKYILGRRVYEQMHARE